MSVSGVRYASLAHNRINDNNSQYFHNLVIVKK